MGFKIGVGLFTGQVPPGSTRSFHQDYADAIALTEVAEEEGFDSAWVSEHHGSGDGYLPSLLPLLAAFAARTERIELGTGVVLAPFHDPLRLAEDFAVVDQISGGRVICGLGIGWREEEFRAFGIDVSSRVRRLTEIVEILKLAWTGERFDYGGRHYRYESVAVTPPPARPIPVYVGGFVDAAIARAGRIADGYISSRAQPDRVADAFRLASEARREAGREGEPLAALLQNAFVTRDPEADWPMIAAGIGHQLGVYAGWRAGTDVPGVPLRVTPPDDATIRSTTAYGTPEDVARFLEPLARILGSHDESHLILRFHYPGMDAAPAAESIRLFAREVAPRLREAASAA
ncbi:MAG TPA: LLM class flavin-dependent oxidoreductase [Actinomycetota bacterium]|nr:LLM class flavin-dependent oxidoreductase [Actinomycetota bacterium]